MINSNILILFTTLSTSVGSADPVTDEDEAEAGTDVEKGTSRSDDLERDFLRRLRRERGGGGGECPAVKTLFYLGFHHQEQMILQGKESRKS